MTAKKKPVRFNARQKAALRDARVQAAEARVVRAAVTYRNGQCSYMRLCEAVDALERARKVGK